MDAGTVKEAPMSRQTTFLLVVALLGLTAAGGVFETGTDSVSAPQQVSSARALLDALDPEQLERAALSFEDGSRLDWHYFPKQRAGLPFSTMGLKQRDRKSVV